MKGCRCDACRKANSRYNKWNQIPGSCDLIPSDEVRRHVKALQAAGMGRRTIAKRSGVSETVVSRLAGLDHSKPADRVRPATAAKLLAVTPDRLAPKALVPSRGAVRRLQALVTIGHTQSSLAAGIGWTPANLGPLVLGQRPYITQATHDLVAALYGHLSMTPGGSTRSRNLALRKGWVPPLGWDDIDADDEPVDTPEAATHREILVDNFHDTYWQHRGDIRAAAVRLDTTVHALQRALYRARKEGIEVRPFRGAKTA